MTPLKLALTGVALVWALYVTWEVNRAASLAAQACWYAADIVNAQPGPGLDSTHRDVKMVCR
jgi:hypothetical protein